MSVVRSRFIIGTSATLMLKQKVNKSQTKTITQYVLLIPRLIRYQLLEPVARDPSKVPVAFFQLSKFPALFSSVNFHHSKVAKICNGTVQFHRKTNAIRSKQRTVSYGTTDNLPSPHL